MGLCFDFFFFFKAPATTEIYTLTLHDALPILSLVVVVGSIGVINSNIRSRISSQPSVLVSEEE